MLRTVIVNLVTGAQSRQKMNMDMTKVRPLVVSLYICESTMNRKNIAISINAVMYEPMVNFLNVSNPP